jgi:hypothetical protein
MVSANIALAGHKDPGLGASGGSPGHDMQSAGGATMTDHGASTYAPGQLMRDANTSSTPPGQLPEPGASGFAPGDSISKGKK